MPIEDASIVGSIQGIQIQEGKNYLAHDANTDHTGELIEILISKITNSSYQVQTEHGAFYILKERVVDNLVDFNSNKHTYKIVEEL